MLLKVVLPDVRTNSSMVAIASGSEDVGHSSRRRLMDLLLTLKLQHLGLVASIAARDCFDISCVVASPAVVAFEISPASKASHKCLAFL